MLIMTLSIKEGCGDKNKEVTCNTWHRADTQINGSCCCFNHPHVFISGVWRAKTDTEMWPDHPQAEADSYPPRVMVRVILIQKPVALIYSFLHAWLCAKHMIFIISWTPRNHPVRLALFLIHRWGTKHRERWPAPSHRTRKRQGWNKPSCLTPEILLPQILDRY